MSATVSLDFIGTTLRQIQADQREDRLARELLQGQIARLEARMVSREDLSDVLRLFSHEITRLQGHLDTRLDQQQVALAEIKAELG